MSTPKNPQQATTAYPLRIPTIIRSRLSAEALKNRRSLNNEIVVRLEASLKPASSATKQTP